MLPAPVVQSGCSSTDPGGSAPPNATVLLRTDRLIHIPSSLTVTKGLTLRAAPGFRPRIGPWHGLAELVVQPAGPRGVVSVSGIRFQEVAVGIEFARGSRHRAVFAHNVVRFDSGSNGGRGVDIFYSSASRGSLSVHDNDISSTGTGIRVRAQGGPALVSRNRVTAPDSTLSEGGIQLFAASSGTVQATLADNLVHDVAGCFCGNPAGILSDAFDSATLDLRVVGNTVARVGLPSASAYGIWIATPDAAAHVDASFYDNVVSSTTGPNLELASSSTATGNLNDSYGGSAPDALGSFDLGTLLTVDPRFAGAASGDFRLAAGSPLVDAGQTCITGQPLARSDLGGRFRVAGNGVDIGAYERRSRFSGATRGRNRSGSDAADVLRGGRGRDVLCGLGGDDRMSGLGGADWIDPGAGADIVHAGPGSDHVQAVDGSRDVIFCGPGVDTAFADPADVLHGCEHVTRIASQ
jgi:RTX calcium-binding nonapeptide repeat (4 copies)